MLPNTKKENGGERKAKNCFAQTLGYNCKPKAQAGSPPFTLLPLYLLPSHPGVRLKYKLSHKLLAQKKKKKK